MILNYTPGGSLRFTLRAAASAGGGSLPMVSCVDGFARQIGRQVRVGERRSWGSFTRQFVRLRSLQNHHPHRFCDIASARRAKQPSPGA